MNLVSVVGIDVIQYDDLISHFGLHKIFIFDEYYSAIVNTKLRYDNKRKLNGIFELGLTERVIISTGHRSEQFNEFLSRYIGQDIDIQIN